MNELMNEYPELKNRNGIDIQRWKICPVGVGSQHDDGSITITKEAANTFANQIEHTPLMYAETDENLPTEHRDRFSKRKVIGAGLKGFVAQDESGIEWLMGDYAVYTDTDPDIIDKIKAFKEDIGASYEIHQSLIDDDNNVYDGGYSGTSVTGKNHSAYRHQALLIADKTGTVTISPPVVETAPIITEPAAPTTKVLMVDDVLKELIGNDYKVKLSELESAKAKVEADIEAIKAEHAQALLEKDASINQLKQEADNLRELTNGFANLTK